MARWWQCKVCAVYLGTFGEDCLDHREQTGHVGADLMRGDPALPPASKEGRARAKQIWEDARAALRGRS